MLTRLKVSGFKNLRNIDVRFGPFTCVAGPNGAGKSNLFDAILFLSRLAEQNLLDAALSVRDEGGPASDIRSIFNRLGNKHTNRIRLEAEMIIPAAGTDDLGQPAKATTTFLRYTVEIKYRKDDSVASGNVLELMEEKLDYLSLRDATKHLKFTHDARAWRMSVLKGRRTTSFITTEHKGKERIIILRQDGVRGRPRRKILARTSPRTILSSVNAESPTAFLARKEMRSWRLLQLEPSAIRKPDDFATKPGMGANGSHLPATITHLAKNVYLESKENKENKENKFPTLQDAEAWVYDQIAARLSELLDDVHSVEVVRDDKRELLTLQVQDKDGTVLPARSLSDGTLRFLALATIELDYETGGVMCLEEPENGIHPSRIPAILSLVQDIAMDVTKPVGADNPLRQVIINTHSPSVVNQVPDDSLVIAELAEVVEDDRRFRTARFGCLENTWREATEEPPNSVPVGKLMAYLSPLSGGNGVSFREKKKSSKDKKCRVIDRHDVQMALDLSQ